MTIEDILAALQAIIDGASDRPLTDEEVERCNELEGQLQTVRRDLEVRSRVNAYQTPNRSDLGVHAAGLEDTSARTDQERAFSSYLRTGIPNSDLEFRAQAEGTGAAGGYLVPEGFINKITERLKAFGGLANEVERFSTTSGNALPWPTNDDTANQGEIVAENAGATGGADLVFGIKTLNAYKYESTGTGGLPLKVSWELAQDSAFDLEGFVERKLAQRIARKQASHWSLGTGTGQPQGAITGATSGRQIANNTTGMTFADIVAATHVIDPEYRESGESIWVMNDAVLAQIENLTDSQGRPLLNASGEGIGGRPEPRLRGFRVVVDNTFPTFVAGGAKTVLFGNLKAGYVIRDVKEVTMIVLRELYATTGQIGYMAWARADGLVQDPNAFTAISAAAA